MTGRAYVVLVLCLASCPVLGAETADQRAIRAADQEWSRLYAARDLDGSVNVVATDGAMLPPNAPRASGHEAIREMTRAFFALPDLTISWAPSDIRVARSGDLGYSTGAYKMSFKDAKGSTISDSGKYSTVWQKQKDGSWKVILDAFNSDLPLTPASP